MSFSLGTCSKAFADATDEGINDFLSTAFSLGLRDLDCSWSYGLGMINRNLGQSALVRDGAFEVTLKIFKDPLNPTMPGNLRKENIDHNISLGIQHFCGSAITSITMHRDDPMVRDVDLAQSILDCLNRVNLKRVGFCQWPLERVNRIVETLARETSYLSYFVEMPWNLAFRNFEDYLTSAKCDGLDTRVYGVLAQGSLIGNFERRDEHCKDFQTPKHHLDEGSITNLTEATLACTNTKARRLYYEADSKPFIDEVIIGASSAEQLVVSGSVIPPKNNRGFE